MNLKAHIPFHQVYFFSLLIIVLGLPLSPFLMSLGLGIMLLNWIAEGEWTRKINEIKANKGLWVFSIIYIVHLLWFFNTSDFLYGFKDIKIKLPILILPLVIGTSKLPSVESIRKIAGLFIASTFVSTIIIVLVAYHVINIPYRDIRYASIFISHIRLSLYIVLIIFMLIYGLIEGLYSSKTFKLSCILLIAWFLGFLILLQAMTGIVILGFAGLLLFFLFYFKGISVIFRIISVFALSLILAMAVYYVNAVVRTYYNKEAINIKDIDLKTANGRYYLHSFDDKSTENGHYVGLYKCVDELKQEWPKRSKMPYDSLDKKGQPIRATMLRYLTSCGVRKDSAGLWSLSDKDIRFIENGNTNNIFNNRLSIKPRIYAIVSEIDHYMQGEQPYGSSVTQRIVFATIALKVISNNLWIGVGTGDVKSSFDEMYNQQYFQVPLEFRLRAHNQYLTFALAFGVPAMLLLCFCFIYPVLMRKKDLFAYAILIILLLSFINEDTLETQSGATFFAFFYALFVFGKSE